MTLKDLKPGTSAIITAVGGDGALRQHFLDMGVIPGTHITVIKYAPLGDPVEIRIHGYELTLRLDDAAKIEAEKLSYDSSDHENNISYAKREHPGLGESGKYHSKSEESPLPEKTVLKFALAGNQNCGKTTLFNRLTGANQHIGNFPGVTVDKKSGPIKDIPYTEVTDLPGIYSLSPYTSEEIVSRRFILDEKPHAIINIADATSIERSLYLTMQLMELDIPVVLALNMMDEVRGNDGTVDINTMEEMLGIPVVPISAAKNEGIDELLLHAVHIAKFCEKPGRTDFCDKNKNGGAVHRAIHAIMHLVEDHAKRASLPLRFAAGKLIEGDDLVLNALQLSQNEKEMLEHIVCQMELESGLDRSAAIADMRYSFISNLCKQAVIKPSVSKEHIRSSRLDKILTGKYTAVPFFIAIMALIFYLTFNVIGAFLQDLLETGISAFTLKIDSVFSNIHINPVIHSLVIDGIFKGIGSVLSFIPVIIILFFFLSLLEDSGYMARVAFVMDKPLRKLGLSGRSIVPMLIGFGCTVPGVMASRTLPSSRDRKMTIILTPFMSCTAKLPIYVFFADAFFPEYSGLITVGLYLLGILIGILIAVIAKNTVFKGEAVPFVMELPNYRMPGAGNVLRLLWDKAKDFLRRAFTVIFAASIIIWFMQTFDFGFNLVQNSHDSILAHIAGIIAPLFTPLGFGDWRFSTALISGFMAKESVVSTLSILFGSTQLLTSAISPISVYALLVFCLLYTPCVAAVAAVKRELGGKWALVIVVGQCIIAWLAALLVRAILILLSSVL